MVENSTAEIREAARQSQMVATMLCRKSPVGEVSRKSGANASAVVAVADNNGDITEEAPSMAASILFMPR